VRTRFCAVATVLAITVPVVQSENMDVYRRSERNREALENYLGPVLYPLHGVARIYVVVQCRTGKCPELPRFKMKKASAGTTGLAAVREIFANDKQTDVTSGPNRIIRIRYGGTPGPLLKTKIRSLHLTALQQYNIIDAEWAIESAKEVKAAVQKLRLETPVTVVSGSVQQPMEGVPHLPSELTDVTVDQALDLFAKTFGFVLRYEECVRPDGTRCFDINHSYVQGGKWFDALRARWDKLREQGFKSDVCPVHHVRLQHAIIYGWSHSWDRVPLDPRPQNPPDQFFKREEKYPMRLGYLERQVPSADFHQKKSERFCPVCQRLFEEDLKRYPAEKVGRIRPLEDYDRASRGDQWGSR
jgi:hypothetical protein